MFSKIDSNEYHVNLVFDNDFIINRNGDVFDPLINKVPVISVDGYDCVVISGIVFRVIDLLVIHFKYIKDYLPKTQLHAVEAFVVDGVKTNNKLQNLGYRFKDGPLEHLKYKGYYYIPEHLNLCMDIGGKIISSLRGTSRSFYTYVNGPNPKNIKGGYYTHTYTIGGVSRSLSRHRSRLMTFKGYPDNVDELQVNHINGIPGDDLLANLEWVTKRENIIHAVSTGLRTQNILVIAKNVWTGEETEYYSITNCANELGYTDTQIGNILAGRTTCKAIKEGFVFKYKDDETPWMSQQEMVREVEKANRSSVIWVRDCKDMSVVVYQSVSEASRKTNIEGSTIEWRFKENNFKPLFGYQFSKDGTFIDFTEEEYLSSLKPNSSKVDARNILTNEVKFYGSARSAQDDQGRKTISQMLRKGRQPLFSDGWMFKYETDEWNDIKDPQKACRNLIQSIVATNVTTGEETVFPSAKALGKALDVSYRIARDIAIKKSDRIYEGYAFRLGES